MIDRWRLAINNWNREDDYVEVSVPEGRDGDRIRDILANAKLAGEISVEFGSGVQLHSDGRKYRLAFVRGYDAEDIVRLCVMELAALPTLTSPAEAAAIEASH